MAKAQKEQFLERGVPDLSRLKGFDPGLTGVDLFCGCGGLTLGLENANIPILAAFDNWDRVINIYQKNFKHDAFIRDLSDPDEIIPVVKKYQPTIIVGGPPCQDFSHAGKRTEDERADLTMSFAKIVIGCGPKWFVMENVDRAQNSKTYKAARKLFIEAGYGLNERVLDASFCGVPQKRKRFFCVGLKGGKEGFLDAQIDSLLGDRPMTVRDYMKGELGIEYYYRHPRNYSRRGIFSIDEPSPTIRGVNRPLPKGYPGHSGDAARPGKHVRPLTTLERARVQTFPKNFHFEGGKTDLEQMIGNAVPVKLAEFVGRAIVLYIMEEDERKRRR